jgi:staphylococcal nuclease domain-containing protein 1
MNACLTLIAVPHKLLALCPLRTTPHCPTGVFNAAAFIQTHGKGRAMTGIVEQVANGSMLRVIMLPSMQSATVHLAGVQAPSMGRRVEPSTAAPVSAPAADAAPAIMEDLGPVLGAPKPVDVVAPLPTGGPSAAAIAGTSTAETFSREAKHITEMRALNRWVYLCTVVLFISWADAFGCQIVGGV